jgi:hypothetical protein
MVAGNFGGVTAGGRENYGLRQWPWFGPSMDVYYSAGQEHVNVIASRGSTLDIWYRTKTATEATVSGKSMFNRYATFFCLVIPIRPGSPEPKSQMAEVMGLMKL